MSSAMHMNVAHGSAVFFCPSLDKTVTVHLPEAGELCDPAVVMFGFPAGVQHVLSRGVVAEEASRIECPVFLGFGERDVTQNPWTEPAGSFRSRHIRLAVIPGLAHGHNFETKRAEFWTRLHPWAQWVASQARQSQV